MVAGRAFGFCWGAKNTMASGPEAALKRWLKREHELVPFPSKFKLRTLELEQDASVVGEWDSDSEAWRTDPDLCISTMSHLILEAAQNVALASSYLVKLEVRSIIIRGKKLQVRASLPWTAKGRAREEGQGSFGEMEPATSTGLLAQQMRHIEKIMTSQAEMQAATLDALKAENFDLRKHRNLDDQEWLQRRKQLEKLLDKTHERDMLTATVKAEQERKDAMLKQIVQVVLPAMAQKVPGIIEKFFPGEKKTELEKVAGALSTGPVLVPGSQTPSPELQQLVKLKAIFSLLPEDKRIEMALALPKDAREELLGILETEATS